MKRVASFSWRSPPPTSVDEQLVLFDDGTARLVVRRPRTALPTIGTYTYKPDKADFAELAKAGAGDVTFDVHAPIPAAVADVQTLASRIADEAREEPEATASFYGRPLGPPTDDIISVSLAVVAAGKRTVEFDLDPGAGAVHFSNHGQPVAWREFPKLEIGFVTTDAEDLGGLGRRAEIKPGDWGAALIKVAAPSPATGIAVQVGGRLYEALPDDQMGSVYLVRTEDMDIGPLA